MISRNEIETLEAEVLQGGHQLVALLAEAVELSAQSVLKTFDNEQDYMDHCVDADFACRVQSQIRKLAPSMLPFATVYGHNVRNHRMELATDSCVLCIRRVQANTSAPSSNSTRYDQRMNNLGQKFLFDEVSEPYNPNEKIFAFVVYEASMQGLQRVELVVQYRDHRDVLVTQIVASYFDERPELDSIDPNRNLPEDESESAGNSFGESQIS